MKTYNDGKVRQDWDTERATFYWKIILDPNYPSNQVPHIIGYSKKRFESEAQDKIYLLKRKICMFYKWGYYPKMKRVEIYMRTGPVIDIQKDPMILILHPTHYDLRESVYFDHLVKYQVKWLEVFYVDVVKKGLPLDTVMPSTRAGQSQDFYLDPTKREHLTIEHLFAYADRLSANGHPPGAVTNYIRQYKAIRGW